VTAPSSALARRLAFLLEADRLKRVERQSSITGGDRRENSAEHSWHLALFALVLADHAPDDVDANRVVAMLLLHDLVEIDAGDTFVYDEAAHADKVEREQAAADRLYALLPDDQASSLRALWEEFEERATPDARFAAALDRLQPLLLNHANHGEPWLRHGITADRVRARNAHIADGSPDLWAAARETIDDAVAQGWLPEE
jgi:putative hydrolase of HD superfamily